MCGTTTAKGGECPAHERRRDRRLTTTEATKEMTVLAPVHPGELLLEEFLKPMGITPYRLAEDIGVRPPRVYEIVHGARSITADTALRLSRYFGMSENYWINAQAHYDLEVTKDRVGQNIQEEVKPHAEVPKAAV
jgi:addiction module HigA family antidote